MKHWKDVVHHTAFRYLDHTEKNIFHGRAYTALTSFAVDDVLALSAAGADTEAAVRLWVHSDTVVLGIPDTRLPHLKEGIRLVSERGYHAIVRNSGGLAVPLDAGVLNLSLVLPSVRGISIHDCYDAMVGFIQHVLRDLTDGIEAYEIVGSYCPGDYDLSISGRKFAGISQRRVKNGAAIQIYLDVNGRGQERAELIRDFYEAARKGEATSFDYPDIEPSVMASLSELLGMELTVDDLKSRVWEAINAVSDRMRTSDFSDDEWEQFTKRYAQMVKRNENVAAMQ
ncbi:biotin/lipoate A/B protein ligase family protein [Lentibacillus halophilus]|uniref:Octanoyl-[GcvH]:protein N-octanoyltransferase n=1 Tax=Lentibacillus halophilus TaxID=295065 RepID=A0ABP3J0I4_9BACI